jgi:putative ABC transport system permease protein
MIRVILRSLLARKLRLLMSTSAIVLGVAFVAGSLTLTDTLGRVFDNLFVTVNAQTDLEVRGHVAIDGATGPMVLRKPVAASLVARIAAVPGVQGVTGDVSAYAQILRKDGTAYKTGGAPAGGVNYDANPATSSITLRQGRAPAGPGEVALDVTTAHKAGFRVGDRITLLLASGRQEPVVTGTFGLGTNDSFGGASIVAFEQRTAERVLGRPGEYDAVRVAAADGISVTDLHRRLASALPGTVEVATGPQIAAESASAVKTALGFFSTLLLAFAGVALFVGAFLIFNTFTMLVAQRQRELAVLRALGASRTQVTGSVLGEALVVGLLASGIGIALGLLVALGLRALVGTFGATLPPGPLVVSTRTVLLSLVVGVVITAVAALLPARKASAVRPIEAMRAAVPGQGSLRRGTVIGALLLVPGVGLLVVGVRGRLPLLGVGCILTFLAVAALAPLLSTPAARLLGAPLTGRVPGRLGRLNAMRNPRRTATTAAALMIGLGMVSAVSLVGASAKASFATDVPAALGADLVVQQQGRGQGIPTGIAQQLAALPEVGRADGLHMDQGRVGGSLTNVTTLPGSAVGRALILKQVSGDVTALAPGRILVDQDEASRLALKVGSALTVQLPRSDPRSYTVVGTYQANLLASKYLLDISASVGFATAEDSVLLLSRKPGVSASALRSAVETVTATLPSAEVRNRKELADSATSQIDTAMAFINVMLLLSIAIAVLGIVNTLALSVIDRTRELGLLRAVGLSRGQTRRMITTEAVIVAVFGALLGIAVGVGFGIALQRGLHDQGITVLAIPYGRLGLFVLAAAVTGVLAAVLPARRAARLNILTAIVST